MNALSTWFRNKKNFFIGLISTILVLIIFILLMDWVVMPLYTKHGNELELPDVTELKFNDAKALLESKGFKVVKDREKYNELYPKGIVLSHSPFPFTKVKKGRRIYLIVSAGEQKVSVPDLVGRSERDAIFILEKNSLGVGEVFYEYNNYQPKGVVADQSIDQGTLVKKDTLINIIVSNGRRPDRFITPEVEGRSLAQAKKLIRSAGLAVGRITTDTFDKLVSGTVVQQSIEPGKEVEQGEKIDLVINKL
ncbi:MAG: PASTA domain-containing protein [bacterium]